jgi:large conductance mechanosensitive channel
MRGENIEEFQYTGFNRGNVVDMAVGIIIGGAFGAVVKSLADDVIMPPIGLLLGNVDFSNLFITLKPGAPGRGATLKGAPVPANSTLSLAPQRI